ncbi:hypothetical protein Tco_0693686 [Tanacetum coccineum]
MMLQSIEYSLGFSESTTSTSSQKVLTSSLEYFDVVIRNCDAVSKHCVPNIDHLRVELQSCPVSSQIESKSRNLERQLNKETLHEKDSNSGLSMIKVQFDNFIHSRVLELSISNLHALEITQDFKAYTNMEAQTFKETIIQNMDSIEQCIVERARHEQELQNRLKSSGIVSDKGNDQNLEHHSNTSGDESSRSRNECNDKSTSGDDTDIRPSYDTKQMLEVPYTAKYNVFDVETQHSEQPENMNSTSLMEKVDSNTTPNSSDMCNNEFKDDQNADDNEDERVVLANLISNLKLVIDENKKIQKQLRNTNTSLAQELKECKSTTEETNSTLGESNRTRDRYFVSLRDKEIELAKYKTFKDHTIENDKLEFVKEKHDELVKQSLLTKSHYEGLVKEKTKVITDLKLKEEKDIDKMISIEKQLKFLNEIVYKRNQSSQTIHMLAPKGPTFNGRQTFANPMYLKKAQYEKPCLYEIPHDQSDPVNRLVLDGEETLTLERESRSKLNKDLVRLYDYTKLNKLVDQAWEKHSHNHCRAPTALDMEVLIKTCLMPLATKTQNDSFAFVHELKQEMHEDLKYVESFVKEINDLESDKAEFSNMYDIQLQECVSNDVMCSYLHSLSDLDAHSELQFLYLHKVKECECLAQKLSKQTDSVSKEVYTKLLRSFTKLEKHLISLELALQQCQEQMKNDTYCEEKTELKKLIEKNKGKGVDTNFEKQSILGKPPLQPIRNQPMVRQPTAYKFERSQLPRHRIASQVGVSHNLTKPVTSHSWPQVRKLSFAKPYDVNAPSPSRNSPKHVSF